MTMVQTFTDGSNYLTQGFQQPEVVTVGINEIPVVSNDILVYPNPTNGSFVLSFTSDGNSQSGIRIYNLAGQVVVEKQLAQAVGLNMVDFDLSIFSQGCTYWNLLQQMQKEKQLQLITK